MSDQQHNEIRTDDGRTIIVVNQQQQQQQDGCMNGCGLGCGLLILASLLLLPFGLLGSAMEGEISGWWVPLIVLIIIVEIVAVLGVVLMWLDKKFGWGLTDPPQPQGAGTKAPRDVLEDDAKNYGRPGPRGSGSSDWDTSSR